MTKKKKPHARATKSARPPSSGAIAQKDEAKKRAPAPSVEAKSPTTRARAADGATGPAATRAKGPAAPTTARAATARRAADAKSTIGASSNERAARAATSGRASAPTPKKMSRMVNDEVKKEPAPGLRGARAKPAGRPAARGPARSASTTAERRDPLEVRAAAPASASTPERRARPSARKRSSPREEPRAPLAERSTDAANVRASASPDEPWAVDGASIPTAERAAFEERDAAARSGVEAAVRAATPPDDASEDTELELVTAPKEGTPASALAPDLEEPEDVRLERLLEAAVRSSDARRAFSEIAQRLGSNESFTPPDDTNLFSAAKELLSLEYYVKQWGRLAMRNRGEEVDDFGLDHAYAERTRPALDALYRHWFRVRVIDVEHVPSAGRALLVANHAGALPWDGLMLQSAVRLEHPAHRELRWLAEDFIAHAPFLGARTNRLGAVRACPDNAERLLAGDQLVAVFPEGEKGLGKPWSKRYEIQRFGRGGFVRLALRLGAPIVPVAIVGSEETHPTLVRSNRLGRLLGLPFLPITPTFPWLGPLGLIPLPSRWVIRFGAPIDLGGEPEASQHDPVRVQQLAEEVRGTVQALVRRALDDRPSTF